MDVFKFLAEASLLGNATILEIIKEIKLTLQNILYTVVLTSDKYHTCHLETLIYVMTTCYKSCTTDGLLAHSQAGEFKFTLDQNLNMPEFSLDSKCYRDKVLGVVFRGLKEKNYMLDYALKPLTPDVVKTFVGECFIRHFIENGLQIFDLQTLFDSSEYFDVCLRLHEVFSQYGFTFRHAMTFIEEVVYRSDEMLKNQLQVQKITKKVSELIQTGKTQGRKIALREEKKRRMDVRFQYVDEKEKPQKDALAVYSLEEDEFGVNAEAIFIEFSKAKQFARESAGIVIKPAYERLIDTYWSLVDQQRITLRPAELAAYFSVQFFKRDDKSESKTIQRLRFFNEVCLALQKKQAGNEIELFLVLLEKAGIDQQVYEKLGRWRSLHLEVESLNFLINCMLYYPPSYKKLASYFLSQGDELFHMAKQVFGKKSLEYLSRMVGQTSNNNLLIDLAVKYLKFMSLFYQLAGESRFPEDLQCKFDKLSFHMYRRLGEYLNALQTFFKDFANHLYVLKLRCELMKCLLQMLRFSANSLPFDADHPFVISFCDLFSEPLSLSVNAEDELATEVYATCVQLASHLFEVLSRPQIMIFVKKLNLGSIVKTLVLIQEIVLGSVGDHLSKNILCERCSSECTYFTCKDKKATLHQKRLADLGFQLCVVITKVRLVFGEKILASLSWLKDKTDYLPHLLEVNKVIDSYLAKFDAFFAEVNSKMAVFSKATGHKKDPAKNAGNPKYTRVVEKQEASDKGQSSLLPVNDKRLDKSDNLSNKGDDEKANNTSKLDAGEYHSPERQDTQDSLKFLITLERQSVNKSEDPGVNTAEDFDIVEVFRKFGNDQSDDGHRQSDQGLSEQREEEMALPPLAKETFKKQDVEFVRSEVVLYKATLASTKVEKAFNHYIKSLEYIRLSNGKAQMTDEELVVIQNRYFFTLPHVVNYCSRQKQTEIIQKLIKFPPRTRKEMFLKEMNMYIGDLGEYQKLYAFKELSWVVWITNVTKYFNVAIIVYINFHSLVALTVANKDTLGQDSFLYSVLIVGMVTSGLCCVFMPIQKLFLAKTFLTRFNSYKNRITLDFQHKQSKSVIEEERKTYIRLYEKYVRIVSKVNVVLQYPKSKYLVALAHYDNLFQFIIFYLSILGVARKSVDESFINLFLVLVETSTIYRLYDNLAVNLWRVLVYLLFLCVLFYQIGVVYYASFVERTSLPRGITCDSLLHCVNTVISFTLIGNHGYTEDYRESFAGQNNRVWRMFADTISFKLVSYFTSVLILGSFVLTSVPGAAAGLQPPHGQRDKVEDQDAMSDLWLWQV